MEFTEEKLREAALLYIQVARIARLLDDNFGRVMEDFKQLASRNPSIPMFSLAKEADRFYYYDPQEIMIRVLTLEEAIVYLGYDQVGEALERWLGGLVSQAIIQGYDLDSSLASWRKQ